MAKTKVYFAEMCSPFTAQLSRAEKNVLLKWLTEGIESIPPNEPLREARLLKMLHETPVV